MDDVFSKYLAARERARERAAKAAEERQKICDVIPDNDATAGEQGNVVKETTNNAYKNNKERRDKKTQKQQKEDEEFDKYWNELIKPKQKDDGYNDVQNQRRESRQRSAGYPGFSTHAFHSNTMMKFSIIGNELRHLLQACSRVNSHDCTLHVSYIAVPT